MNKESTPLPVSLVYLENLVRDYLLELESSTTTSVSILMVAGLVSQLRVILEAREWVDRYPVLIFYADWLLHRRLRGNSKTWAKIVTATNALTKNLNAHAGGSTIDDMTRGFEIHQLRSEFNNLSEALNFAKGVFVKDQNWVAFSSAILILLVGRRLELADDNNTKSTPFKNEINNITSVVPGKAIELAEDNEKLLWCFETTGSKPLKFFGQFNPALFL